MEIGIRGTHTVAVTKENTAASVGSGLLPVFSTPSLVAGMEYAASSSVAPCLEEGCTTVGTKLQINHISATPVGMTVTFESELTEIDGRRLVFSVRAYDGVCEVGNGIHERFIVKSEKFMAKASAKAEAVKF